MIGLKLRGLLGLFNGRTFLVRTFLVAPSITHPLVSQVLLSPDQEERDGWAVLPQFRNPLQPDVFQGGRVHDGEADEEDLGVGVGHGPQFLVAFLSCQSKKYSISGKPISGI